MLNIEHTGNEPRLKATTDQITEHIVFFLKNVRNNLHLTDVLNSDLQRDPEAAFHAISKSHSAVQKQRAIAGALLSLSMTPGTCTQVSAPRTQ